ATICGSLGVDAAPSIDAAQRAAVAAMGPLHVQVRGLFSGNVNTGRFYLRAYPERRDGANVFHRIQQAMGRPTTDLYVIGLWNLTDHLDAREAAALDAILTDWCDVPLLDLEARELWLMGARDDLVLDAEIAERIALTG
ncbi:hypothetical protein DUP91_28970, partial [Salmonella enterica subsp. enterica]|nr:hypothetical protein [Salmonella enterica subsp. enterica]